MKLEYTFEQEQLFINKTTTHIRLVQENMKKIALNGGIFGVKPVDIIRRAFLHDHSKFDKSIYEGYILYNVRNHAREQNLPIPEYSKELDEYIFNCVKKHRSQSRHHPEYYNDVNEMQPMDLIEMICDWTSISQEFKTQVYKSSRDFANFSIGNMYMFDEIHTKQIYDLIELLTTLNGREW